jgi:hypothetical protein
MKTTHADAESIHEMCCVLFPGRVYPAPACIEATTPIEQKAPLGEYPLRPVGGMRGFLGTCGTRHCTAGDGRLRTLIRWMNYLPARSSPRRVCMQCLILLPDSLAPPGTNPPQSAPFQRTVHESPPCPARTHARTTCCFLSCPV